MKIRVAVIFGGESVEHEISIISAHQAMEHFDTSKYEIVPVYISKDSTWYTGDVLQDIEHFKDLDFIVKNAKQVRLITEKNRYFLYEYPFKMFKKKPLVEFDIAFPIVHGTNVEDGSIQGMFEANKIPYAGPNLLGAAVGQDKVMQKLIWQASNLPVVPYIWFYANTWDSLKNQYVDSLEQQLDYPMIIKPASLGSSVGISLAKNKAELITGIDDAVTYDSKIIVEKALQDFTEINCSVIGNEDVAESSVLEKVFSNDEILSYQDKYVGGSSQSTKAGAKVTSGMKTATKTGENSGGMANTSREVPANLDPKMTHAIRQLAEISFKTLSMSGTSRIDFLIDNKTNKVYLNEINTIPGSLAFYLWEASGKSFSELLTQMIDIAITRFRKKEKQVFTYDTNVLAMQGNASGSKGSKGGSKGTTAKPSTHTHLSSGIEKNNVHQQETMAHDIAAQSSATIDELDNAVELLDENTSSDEVAKLVQQATSELEGIAKIVDEAIKTDEETEEAIKTALETTHEMTLDLSGEDIK